jgi:pilus assembly protein CpaB
MVVVAARDLERGATVTPSDVKVIRWSGSLPPDGAYSMVTQVDGLVVARKVAANQTLTNTSVISPVSGGELGIPAGMRAMSLQVAETGGVAAMLRPGYRIDVQAISGTGRDAELRTVLHNVEILKVDGRQDGGRPFLTLLVSPREAEILGLADAAAKLRVVLRNPLDSETRDRGTVAMSGLMHRGMPTPDPRPDVAPARPRPVATASATKPKPETPGLTALPAAMPAACATPAGPSDK